MTRIDAKRFVPLFHSALRALLSIALALFCLWGAATIAQDASASPPRVFVLDAVALQNLRARIAAGGVHEPALDKLRADADRELKQEPLSVTSKEIAPPSGDKHDYMSLAPYWWPDPSKPGGLPYIRKDGVTNPDIQRVPDHKNFDQLMSATHTLALAYYLFREERYAHKATGLLRAWFLDPATRMNPNLQYAQAVRGVNEGRGTGLIETRGIGKVVDTVGLLAGSLAWTAADQQGMQKWLADFLHWMLESGNGKDEAAAKNNHGTYYDVQIAVLALGTGKTDIAKRVLEEVPTKRIAVQIEPDGRQPLELARTKSLGYSTMNLNGLFELACLGGHVGVDLWNFRTSDGRSLRKALDFLVPYVTGQQKWPGEQIVEFNASEIVPPLLAAADRYHEPRYADAAAKADPSALHTPEALLIRSKN
jgi:hypothetical protein